MSSFYHSKGKLFNYGKKECFSSSFHGSLVHFQSFESPNESNITFSWIDPLVTYGSTDILPLPAFICKILQLAQNFLCSLPIMTLFQLWELIRKYMMLAVLQKSIPPCGIICILMWLENPHKLFPSHFRLGHLSLIGNSLKLPFIVIVMFSCQMAGNSKL